MIRFADYKPLIGCIRVSSRRRALSEGSVPTAGGRCSSLSAYVGTVRLLGLGTPFPQVNGVQRIQVAGSTYVSLHAMMES